MLRISGYLEESVRKQHTSTTDVPLKEIRAIKKLHFQILERNTEKAIYIFSDLLYAVDLFWNSNHLK